MDIKKFDYKLMIINTMADIKLHVHQKKNTAIKDQNVYIEDYLIKKKDSQTNLSDDKNLNKQNYHASTILKSRKKGIKAYNKRFMIFNNSIKVKNASIKLAGTIGAKEATNQIEGSEELKQSTIIAYNFTKSVTGVTSKGAKLFRQKFLEEKKRKIKKVEASKKIAKRQIIKTTTNSAKTAAKESGKAFAKETAKVECQHFVGQFL